MVFLTYYVHSDEVSFRLETLQTGIPVGIAEFGETTIFKSDENMTMQMQTSSFTQGMWIGRGPDSGEHLLATSHGVVTSRAISRIIISEKLENALQQYDKSSMESQAEIELFICHYSYNTVQLNNQFL
jgi:hypothetical protein